jgi:hypothetical protein
VEGPRDDRASAESGRLRCFYKDVIAQEFMRHPIKSRSAFYFKVGKLRRRSRIPPRCN